MIGKIKTDMAAALSSKIKFQYVKKICLIKFPKYINNYFVHLFLNI